jgi:hypothetical protein
VAKVSGASQWRWHAVHRSNEMDYSDQPRRRKRTERRARPRRSRASRPPKAPRASTVAVSMVAAAAVVVVVLEPMRMMTMGAWAHRSRARGRWPSRAGGLGRGPHPGAPPRRHGSCRSKDDACVHVCVRPRRNGAVRHQSISLNQSINHPISTYLSARVKSSQTRRMSSLWSMSALMGICRKLSSWPPPPSWSSSRPAPAAAPAVAAVADILNDDKQARRRAGGRERARLNS